MELEERGILAPRLGRTADELAAEAGRLLPALGTDLGSAARLFDDVRYGDRDGTPAGYALVKRVDAEIRSARVTVSADAQLPALASHGASR
jgi:hypothetical protein